MKKVVYLICCFSLLTACSKEEKEETPTEKPRSYTPMEIGNFWVYEHFLVDTLGNETLLPEIDTISISRKIHKRGHAYYVYSGTNHPFITTHESILWALRDSSGYIVDTNGFIYFAEKDFSDSLEVTYTLNQKGDTLVSFVYQMKVEPNQIQTAAGTFPALNYQSLIRAYPALNLPSDVPNPRPRNTHYALGVGRIQETYFYAFQKDHYVQKLVNWGIQ